MNTYIPEMVFFLVFLWLYNSICSYDDIREGYCAQCTERVIAPGVFAHPKHTAGLGWL